MSDGLKTEDTVKHWFAGTGTILKLNGSTSLVEWHGDGAAHKGRRTSGVAYTRHLTKQAERNDG